MALITLEDLPSFIKPNTVLAGLDIGEKTIGLALSDACLYFAHMRPVIKRKKFSVDSSMLLDFFAKNNVVAAVVGFPINMNNTQGPSSQRIRSFIYNMNKVSDFPFLLQDERLSTVAAHKMLNEMNFSRKQKSEKIDSAAAAFILQGVLDFLQFSCG